MHFIDECAGWEGQTYLSLNNTDQDQGYWDCYMDAGLAALAKRAEIVTSFYISGDFNQRMFDAVMALPNLNTIMFHPCASGWYRLVTRASVKRVEMSRVVDLDLLLACSESPNVELVDMRRCPQTHAFYDAAGRVASSATEMFVVMEEGVVPEPMGDAFVHAVRTSRTLKKLLISSAEVPGSILSGGLESLTVGLIHKTQDIIDGAEDGVVELEFVNSDAVTVDSICRLIQRVRTLRTIRARCNIDGHATLVRVLHERGEDLEHVYFGHAVDNEIQTALRCSRVYAKMRAFMGPRHPARTPHGSFMRADGDTACAHRVLGFLM